MMVVCCGQLSVAYYGANAPLGIETTYEPQRPGCSWYTELWRHWNIFGCFRPQLVNRRLNTESAEAKRSCSGAVVSELFESHRGRDDHVDWSEATALDAALDSKLARFSARECTGVARRAPVQSCFAHATTDEAMDLAQTQRFVYCRVAQLAIECREHVCGL